MHHESESTMISSAPTLPAVAHGPSALRALPRALLVTGVRLLLVALVLTAIALRLSVAVCVRVVRLHAAPNFATAALYFAIAPVVYFNVF
jgi:hypothetical protein